MRHSTSNPRPIVLACLASAIVVVSASAQELTPIDPTVADVGPISMSLREVQVDLRQPFDFDEVFSVGGADELLVRASGALYAAFPQSDYATTEQGPVAIVPDAAQFFIGKERFDQWIEEQAMLRGDREIEPRRDTRRSTLISLRRVEHPIASLLNTSADESRLTLLVEESFDDNQWQAESQDLAVLANYPPPLRRPAPAPVLIEPEILPPIVGDPAYRAQRIESLMTMAAQAAGDAS